MDALFLAIKTHLPVISSSTKELATGPKKKKRTAAANKKKRPVRATTAAKKRVAEVPLPPAKKRYAYTIEEKENIVEEAYALPNNVKPTARVYSVQPSNIRQWKRRITELKASTDVKYDRIKRLKQYGCGDKPHHAEKFKDLRQYYDLVLAQGKEVSVNMLCAEYRRLTGEAQARHSLLRQRVYRWMKKEDIVVRYCRLPAPEATEMNTTEFYESK